jgi:hypothetical protein
MKIYQRHVLPFGFKGSSIWASAFHWFYYRKDTENNTITVITNHTPQYVAQYQLTPQQMRAFNKGRLGITPPGCCNASGGKSIEEPPQTIIQRNIENLADLKRILAALGIFDIVITNPKMAKQYAKTKINQRLYRKVTVTA